jgi:Methionine synthase I (cobalamin-dependent), methyltransferase domain
VKVPVWRYNLEEPEIVVQLHQAYIDAGSRVILTNTFVPNRDAVKTSPYSLEEAVSASVRLARKAAG